MVERKSIDIVVKGCSVTLYCDAVFRRHSVTSLTDEPCLIYPYILHLSFFNPNFPSSQKYKKSYFSHLHSWEFIVQFYLLWQLRFEVLKTTSQECLLLPMSTISKRCSKHLHLDENFARGVINYLRSKAALRQSFLACVYCMQLRFQSNYLGFSQSR